MILRYGDTSFAWVTVFAGKVRQSPCPFFPASRGCRSRWKSQK
jgi:hypothetical protein